VEFPRGLFEFRASGPQRCAPRALLGLKLHSLILDFLGLNFDDSLHGVDSCCRRQKLAFSWDIAFAVHKFAVVVVVVVVGDGSVGAEGLQPCQFFLEGLNLRRLLIQHAHQLADVDAINDSSIPLILFVVFIPSLLVAVTAVVFIGSGGGEE